MMFAGHLPTKHFDLAEWQAMPVWQPKDVGECPPDGFSRSRLRGKPIVGFWGLSDYERRIVAYAVRPIVRVPMGRRVVSDNHQMLYEWWTSDSVRRARARLDCVGRA